MSGSSRNLNLERVSIIGSGNWGTTVAKVVGTNVVNLNAVDNEIKIWVFEEVVDGKKLTEIINSTNENVKYLPGVKLPKNVVASPNLLEVVKDATCLIFVTPHQFINSLLDQLKGHIREDAKAISLVKGVHVGTQGITLISELIEEKLGIDVCTLSGANIADEIAIERFCETTIGYSSSENGELFKALFNTNYLLVNLVEDKAGVEIGGALKNIVAIAAGLVDGLELGSNAKAAIIRIGFMEMLAFAKTYLQNVKDSTFMESCGIGDVMTTCYGGRNRRVSEAFVKTGKTFEELELEMLNGQKLQGTITSKEVYQFLQHKGHTAKFPLFTKVYSICYQGLEPASIVRF